MKAIVIALGTMLVLGLAASSPTAASPIVNCATPGLVHNTGNVVPTLNAQPACESETRCQGPWWQGTRYWEVEGKFATGEGEVLFTLFCGFVDNDEDGENDPWVQCTASIQGVTCTSELREGGDGDAECFYEVIDGDADVIDGRCVDPANPWIFIRARPLLP